MRAFVLLIALLGVASAANLRTRNKACTKTSDASSAEAAKKHADACCGECTDGCCMASVGKCANIPLTTELNKFCQTNMLAGHIDTLREIANLDYSSIWNKARIESEETETTDSQLSVDTAMHATEQTKKQTSIVGVAAALSAKETEVKRSLDAIQIMNSQIRSLADDRETEEKEFNDKIKDAKTKESEAEAQFKGLTKQQSEASSNIQKLKTEVAKCSQEAEAIKTERKNLKSEQDEILREQKSSVGNLDNLVKLSIEELKSASSELEEAQSNLVTVKKRDTEAKKEELELQTKIKGMEKDIKELLVATNEHVHRRRRVMVKIDEMASFLQVGTASIDDSVMGLDKKLTQLRSILQKIADILAILKQKKAENDGAHAAALQNLDAKWKDLNTKLDEATSKAQHLAIRMQSIKEIFERAQQTFQQSINDLRLALQTAENAVTELKVKNEELQAALNTLVIELQVLEHKKGVCDGNKDEFIAAIKSAKATFDKQLKALEEERRKLLLRKTELDANVVSARGQLDTVGLQTQRLDENFRVMQETSSVLKGQVDTKAQELQNQAKKLAMQKKLLEGQKRELIVAADGDEEEANKAYESVVAATPFSERSKELANVHNP